MFRLLTGAHFTHLLKGNNVVNSTQRYAAAQIIFREKKTCCDCKKEKAIDDFPKNRCSPDWHHSLCRECAATRSRKQRERRKQQTRKKRGKKKCSTCQERKHITFFHKDISTSDGLSSLCKRCVRQKSQAYKNGPKIVRGSKQCAHCKVIKPIDDFCLSRTTADWRKSFCKKCDYKKTKNDLRLRLRSVIANAINKYSTTGKVKKIKDYGIDIVAIHEKLGQKPGENYCIDHIIPLRAFDYNNDTHIKASWHPDNLQWLTNEENSFKSGKYAPAQLEKYLARFGVNNA